MNGPPTFSPSSYPSTFGRVRQAALRRTSGPATILISVTVNGEPHALVEPTTLAALIEALGHAPNAVATAVNGQFVPRDARQQRPLQGGDAVTVFQAIVGG
jgi:sulfur carrier protein